MVLFLEEQRKPLLRLRQPMLPLQARLPGYGAQGLTLMPHWLLLPQQPFLTPLIRDENSRLVTMVVG